MSTSRALSLAVAALLALSGCGPKDPDPLPFAPASPKASPDPTKPGPFPVGVRTVTFADTTRPKPDGSPRLLVTEVWYPATQDQRGKEGVTYDVRTVFTPEQQAMLVGADVPLLVTDAVRDAPIAKTHGPFPLVFFSHGQGAIRWQSTYYTVLLASHGYVVVSPDHEGGTLYEAVRGELQNVAVGVATRPQDIIWLLAKLKRLRADDPLYDTLNGMVDFDEVGVTGHSFGALTSLRVAAMSPDFKVIVPQAPTATDIAWLGLPQPVTLTIPVMIQAAHNDQTLKWDEHIAPSWPTLQRPRWLLDITNGGHFTFSDLCRFDLAKVASQVQFNIPGANVENVLRDGCGPNAPPPDVAQPIINHFAIGLFNAVLRGDEKAKEALTQENADRLGPGVAVVTADP